MHRRTLLVALAAGCLALGGCGGTPGATISGDVTYDGQPVKKGRISFTPKSGKGQPVGAEILDGKYSVQGVSAGTQIVHVSAADENAKPLSTEDMMNAAKDPEKRKKLPPGGVFLNETIPANAGGNDSEVEVTGSSMEKSFHLTKPKQ